MDWKQLHLLGLGAVLSTLTAVGACSDETPQPPLDEDDDNATEEEPVDGEEDDGVDAGTKKPDSGKAMVDAKVVPVDPTPGDGGGTTDLDPKGDAGDEDPAPPSAGGFPRSDEVNVANKGPYKFATYEEGLKNAAYASSVMYYPSDATPPFAAIVFSPGFTATKESYTFLGEMLASHGFAVLLTTPTSTSDQPQPRGKDLEAAFAQIATENTRSGGPLEGKLAPDRICITGHSMGGGGTLWGATSLGSKIKCAVPLQPWQPGQSFDKITAPTLFIASQSDTIAGVSSNASTHYESIPDSVEKIYAEFKGADHYLSTNRGVKYDAQASFIVSFYKLHLEDDTRYRDYLYGDKVLMSELSKYEKSK